MTVIEAPELPKGYRFRVTRDTDHDIYISLEEKRTFFWTRIERTWASSYVHTSKIEVQVQAGMLELIKRLQKRKDNLHKLEEQSKVLGIYPPRKNIGEVNGG